MHILISYTDGTTETVPVIIEAGTVSVGQKWVPGHLVGNPSRCYFKSDFFMMALGEAQEREGAVTPEPGDGALGVEPFTWKVIGTDEEFAEGLLRKWDERLGADFEPSGDPLRFLTVDRMGDKAARIEFLNDWEVWSFILQDPAETLAGIRQADRRPR